MTEAALQFGTGKALVGVVTEPVEERDDAGLPAILLLNSGLVHHVGPNRLWVRLARSMAGRGFVSLRFDLSGIGDSMASTDRLSASERWVKEVRDAMDVLAQTRGVDRFVLVGNCSGATLAYQAALADPRVVGAALLNPRGRRVARYFLRLVLTNPKSWLRIFSARTRLPKRSRWPARPARPAGGQRSVDVAGLRALAARGADLLVASSEWDPGYDFFHHAMRGQLVAPEMRDRVTLEMVPGANHEFTLLANQERLVRIVEDWTTRMRDQRWRQPQPTLR